MPIEMPIEPAALCGAEPVARLCIGPVHAFYAEPVLQQEQWAKRSPLGPLLFEYTWGQALSRS